MIVHFQNMDGGCDPVVSQPDPMSHNNRRIVTAQSVVQRDKEAALWLEVTPAFFATNEVDGMPSRASDTQDFQLQAKLDFGVAEGMAAVFEQTVFAKGFRSAINSAKGEIVAVEFFNDVR